MVAFGSNGRDVPITPSSTFCRSGCEEAMIVCLTELDIGGESASCRYGAASEKIPTAKALVSGPSVTFA
jgi:hypothetical protein